MTTFRLATGALAAAAIESDSPNGPNECMVLDLGPDHPSRTGLLLADVEVEDGTIREARIQPGFNHRSAEKLFEVRDYRQALMLADRHDWQAPFIGELGLALVCEQLMGLQPPARATWLRTLLCEHARIGSHLAHLSWLPHHHGARELSAQVRAARREGRALMLRASGNRVHPMLNRLGGLACDIDAELLHELTVWARNCATIAMELAVLASETGTGRAIGVITASQVDAYSLSGPVAAASGVPRSARRQSTGLAHDELPTFPFQAPSTNGDALARFLFLAEEIRQSALIVAACEERLRDISGPVDTKLSKIVKVPDSEAYLAIDAPWGMTGYWLVSRAERTPWRLKLRTPGFANVQALQLALVGTAIDEAATVVASLGWTAGDLDK